MLELESLISGNIRNFLQEDLFWFFGGFGLGSAPDGSYIYYFNIVALFPAEAVVIK